MDAEQDRRALGYWLGRVMREERGDLPARYVATVLDVTESRVTRFERGEGEATLPAGTDVMLAAYAALLDEPDPRTYYARALALWHAEGQPPALAPSRRAVAAAQRARESGQRSARTPAPNRKTQATG